MTPTSPPIVSSLPRDSSRSVKAAATALTKALVVLVGGVTAVVVSRGLQPGGRGAYAVIVTLASVGMTFGHFSVEQAHVRLWREIEQPQTLAANAVVLGLAAGMVAATVIWFVVRALGPKTVPVTSYPLLGVALMAVPLGVVALYLNGLLVLDDRIGRVNTASLLSAIVQCGALVACALLHRLTVGAVVVIWAATTALPLLVTLNAFGARPSDLRPGLAARTILLGTRYHLGLASLYLLFRVDVLLLNARVSKDQVGLYSLAVTLAELIYLLTDSVAQVTLPRQVSADLVDAALLTARAARTNLLLACGAFAAVAGLAPSFVPMVFGPAFRGSVPALVALGPGVMALAMTRPLGAFLIRFDRPLLISSAIVSAMVVNVGMNLALIPGLGIKGASIASSVAYALLAATYVRWFCKWSALPLSVFIPRVDDLRGPTGALVRSVSGGGRWSIKT